MPIRMTRFLIAVFVLCAASGVAAQQRPLTTEDPETIGTGRVLLEAGLDYAREAEYPVSGLEGQLFRFPLLGGSGFSFHSLEKREQSADGAGVTPVRIKHGAGHP